MVPHVRLSVSLAGPRPSGSAGPSRRCQGCLPPSPASPGSGCPQLQWTRCDESTAVSFHHGTVRERLVAHERIDPQVAVRAGVQRSFPELGHLNVELGRHPRELRRRDAVDPIAFTRSSTRRVETPSTYAWPITVTNACSARRRATGASPGSRCPAAAWGRPGRSCRPWCPSHPSQASTTPLRHPSQGHKLLPLLVTNPIAFSIECHHFNNSRLYLYRTNVKSQRDV